jgi:hypothetical protein
MAKAPKGKKDLFEQCSETTQNSIIPAAQHGRSFSIKNPERISVKKIQVDDCLIADERERCDYAFEIGNDPHCVVYLELKGKNIEKAYSQLCSTIQHLSGIHSNLKKICHVVASRIPKAGPEVQVLKLRMQRQHQATLMVGTNKVEIDLSKEPYRT